MIESKNFITISAEHLLNVRIGISLKNFKQLSNRQNLGFLGKIL